MKTNPHLKAEYLEAVDNQIRDNNPPETKQTYFRLIDEGHSEQEAKKLIACAIASESYEIMKNKEPFNLPRFLKTLNSLPEIIME